MSKIEWDDIKEIQTQNSGGDTNKESVYAELKEGANHFRIASDEKHVTMVYFAWGRFMKSADELGAENPVCPLAKEKDEKNNYFRARPYYLFKVIERRSKKLRVLRVGRQVAHNIKMFATQEGWGSPTNYDINIQKGPRGSQPLYIVIPSAPKPMSAEDKELVANDAIDLAKHAKPSKVEWVQDFITKFKPGAKETTTTATASATAKTKPQTQKTAPAVKEPEVSNDFEDPSNEIDAEFENI